MSFRIDLFFSSHRLSIVFSVLILASFVISTASTAENDRPVLKGPYLGQAPPGDEPELFARGIISVSKEHGAPAFSPRGDEVFWCSLRDGEKMKVFHMKVENGVWSRPEKLFNGANPFFSVDGERLYYVARGMFGSRDIKVRNRSGDGWSRAVNLGAPFDSDIMMWNPSIAASGNMYFVTLDGSHRYHIYRSESVGGEYAAPVESGGEISGQGPFIAPDESYLIFGSMRAGGFGREDLYISYRLPDGSWSDPINLGDLINTEAFEYYPRVSPDGRYLFFIRSMNVYWVSAGFIERLRPAGVE